LPAQPWCPQGRRSEAVHVCCVFAA
jgi:hypothetical protein